MHTWYTHLIDNPDLMDNGVGIKPGDELVSGVQVQSLHIPTARWPTGKLGFLTPHQTVNGMQTQLTEEVVTQCGAGGGEVGE